MFQSDTLDEDDEGQDLLGEVPDCGVGACEMDEASMPFAELRLAEAASARDAAAALEAEAGFQGAVSQPMGCAHGPADLHTRLAAAAPRALHDGLRHPLLAVGMAMPQAHAAQAGQGPVMAPMAPCAGRAAGPLPQQAATPPKVARLHAPADFRQEATLGARPAGGAVAPAPQPASGRGASEPPLQGRPGHAGAEADGPQLLAAHVPRGPPGPHILVWRCRHPHGLFSMFSLALGHAQTCEQKGWALIVDWSSEELLYRGPPGEPNLWTAFFHQPAELAVQKSALVWALRQGQVCETDKHEVVFGAYRGVVEGYGVIPRHQASLGRALVRRTVALREKFAQRVKAVAEMLLGGGYRWLAVHIRRADKACEAKANFDLDDEDLLLRIVAQCAAWRCNAVFLCTDDAALKVRLTARLEASLAQGGAGLLVSTFPATLSAAAGQAAHFDKSLDSYQKAEDVVMEALLMARGCHGLLSTYSNVSAAVVYLSPEGYPYSTFWDPVEPITEVAAKDVLLAAASCGVEAGAQEGLDAVPSLTCAN